MKEKGIVLESIKLNYTKRVDIGLFFIYKNEVLFDLV